MSTTVTYKGNTLTTVSNATKTLKTAGKYMEGDVILTDSSMFSLQSKNVTYTPSETAQSATITADSGYNGLSSVDVSVDAISSTYVGSGITQRTSTDLMANGATITVPAGYYSAQASKTVASGSAMVDSRITTTPSVSIDENGLITARLNGSVGATPVITEGYITTGTAGSINYSGSKTLQLNTQAATTITPGTTDQTIAAGTYLTGAQTITGDADLVASNIISTANIFGVQGSVVVQNYYTGSSAPSSSLGQNGDIYLQE